MNSASNAALRCCHCVVNVFENVYANILTDDECVECHPRSVTGSRVITCPGTPLNSRTNLARISVLMSMNSFSIHMFTVHLIFHFYGNVRPLDIRFLLFYTMSSISAFILKNLNTDWRYSLVIVGNIMTVKESRFYLQFSFSTSLCSVKNMLSLYIFVDCLCKNVVTIIGITQLWSVCSTTIYNSTNVFL